jgi:light-regulated signal transduction histidine kinase (bacteriophytochrome)
VPFWVRVEATTAQDVVSVWRAVVSDITAGKRAEQLIQTQSDELQEFAYALTHDLQEPLRLVVNFTQMLAQEYQGKLGEDADKYIGYSVEGALRIEALLNGLLNYLELSERDSDRSSLIDCNHVLAQAVLSLQTAIQQSGATVTSEPLPTVQSQEAMLAQIFQNLIGNSIKYRGQAAPTIHISAEKTAEEWLISVRDNGIGIAPADFEFVFGMFRRLHGREIPGTGIGLALCRKLVERQGGRIWVESKKGSGATFKFTIPSAGPL